MVSKVLLSWEEIENDVSLLADKVSKFKPTCIIGIANGGMIPATLLAKKLKVDKLLSCNFKSYGEDNIPRKDREHCSTDYVKKVTFPPSCDFKTGKVLIVDDLSDTGYTLQQVSDCINAAMKLWDTSHLIPQVATLYYKPKTTFMPDYTVKEFGNDKWIVFPWER